MPTGATALPSGKRPTPAEPGSLYETFIEMAQARALPPECCELADRKEIALDARTAQVTLHFGVAPRDPRIIPAVTFHVHIGEGAAILGRCLVQWRMSGWKAAWFILDRNYKLFLEDTLDHVLDNKYAEYRSEILLTFDLFRAELERRVRATGRPLPDRPLF